ncbi:MAG: hypothetical protein P1U58_13910 [Verrucomicrobiales bacterium]|nr:hypothetical protein [Verrucomicrobiales bacterium]
MPKTLSWFRVYVVILGLLYLGLIALGVVFLVLPPEKLDMSLGQNVLVGWVFILFGIIFSLFVIPSFFLPQRGGAWVYGLAVIILGITSVVLIPSLFLSSSSGCGNR